MSCTHQDEGEDAKRDAEHQPPMHRPNAEDIAQHRRQPESDSVEGLFKLAGSRIGPSTAYVNTAIAI